MEKTFNFLVVAPCFENNSHNSGLDWNTRMRLLTAAHLFKEEKAIKIIVGGGKLREMKESFSELMKKYLVKLGVPKVRIITEVHTFDTASQIDWISKHINGSISYVGIMTDSAQAGHVNALTKGHEILCRVLLMEEIVKEIPNNRHYLRFFKKMNNSPEWRIFQLRELAMKLFTNFFDPKGNLIGIISQKRRKN